MGMRARMARDVRWIHSQAMGRRTALPSLDLPVEEKA
jgi:hypothetical protein